MKLNSQLFCDVCGLPDEKNNLRADIPLVYQEKIEGENKQWGGRILSDVHDACVKRVEEYLMENVVKPRKKV